jgi:hypothetical protein
MQADSPFQMGSSAIIRGSGAVSVAVHATQNESHLNEYFTERDGGERGDLDNESLSRFASTL